MSDLNDVVQQIRDKGWVPSIGTEFDRVARCVWASALRIGASRPAIYPSPNQAIGQGATPMDAARALLVDIERTEQRK